MDFEAIAAINEAEEQARRSRAKVMTDVRARESFAETEGKILVGDTVNRAKTELQETRVKSDATAVAAAATIAKETEDIKAAMRMQAEKRLEKAVSLIVERIVNG